MRNLLPVLASHPVMSGIAIGVLAVLVAPLAILLWGMWDEFVAVVFYGRDPRRWGHLTDAKKKAKHHDAPR